MDAEAATYVRELQWLLGQMCVSLRGLGPAPLNWRPDTGAANSAYAIASHVAAVTRVYALGFGCGHAVQRDRPAEFAAAGADAGALIEALESLAREIGAAVAALTPADLERRLTPSRALWGTGPIHEIAARDALVESIRHAGIHLGELRLTRDLALREQEKTTMQELVTLAESIAARLKARKETVAVAESSAGGLISAALLAVPGASAYFLGGGVIYTQAARRGLLQVPDDAVKGIRSSTEAYAQVKARAIRERVGATWGVAETGATGPTGNRYGDAAGHACLAVAGPVERAVTLETGSGDREANMQAFARAALELFAAALGQ
jgi:PncC family amidohydrolase